MFQSIIAMETLLEQQRRYHEERERLMDAMVGESLHSGIIPGASSAASGKSAFSDVTLSHRDTVNSMHRKVHYILRMFTPDFSTFLYYSSSFQSNTVLYHCPQIAKYD